MSSSLGGRASSRSTASSSIAHQKNCWTSLLSAALETWAHQLLYTRSVYPNDSFGAVRFLGVQCFVNRHPDVVSYIKATVQLAVPALLRGAADQLSLIVTGEREDSSTAPRDDREDTATVLDTLEEYILRMTDYCGTDLSHPGGEDLTSQFQRALRDMVIRVRSLEGTCRTFASDDTVSFRLELRLTEEPVLSADMNEAMAGGTWCIPANVSHGKQGGHVLRPLHRTETPVGMLHFVQRRASSHSARDTNGD
jgi:hypothetical protein